MAKMIRWPYGQLLTSPYVNTLTSISQNYKWNNHQQLCSHLHSVHHPTSQDQTLFSNILWGSSPRIYLKKKRQLLDQLNPLEFLSCYDWKAGINNTNAPFDLIAHIGNILLERKYSLMGLAMPYWSETVTTCISHNHQEKQPYEMGLQLGKQTDEPCARVKWMLITYYSIGNKQFALS